MGRLIKQGLNGADVRAVQDVLNFHIRRLGPLKVDGIFGRMTHARVVEFQKANQLKADGIVGPNTMLKLFEEEQLPISLALVPNAAPAQNGRPNAIKPPRLLPPLPVPFILPPDSSIGIPALTSPGQTLTFLVSTPIRNDPVDPALASFQEIIRLLDQLPQNFPFRGTILGAVPKPVKKVGPLALDPVVPMSFGFKWGVDPVFELKSLGPPINFLVGAKANARYVLKLVDKPGITVPQLGLFVQGDFKSTIDWTSNSAQSKPQIDLKGAFRIGVQGTF